MGGRYNLPHKPNPYKENPTTVVPKLPINDWTDLPDLEPGDKVIREDGVAYTIAATAARSSTPMAPITIPSR